MQKSFLFMKKVLSITVLSCVGGVGMCMEVWAYGARPTGMQSSGMQVRQQATQVTPRSGGIQVSYSRAGPRSGSARSGSGNGVRNPYHGGNRAGTVRGSGRAYQSPRGTVTRRDNTVQAQRRSQARQRQQRNRYDVAPMTGTGVRNPYYTGTPAFARSFRNNLRNNRGYAQRIRTNAYGVVYRDNYNHYQPVFMQQGNVPIQNIPGYQTLPGQPFCYVSNPQLHQTRHGRVYQEVTCRQPRNASHQNIPALQVCYETSPQMLQSRRGTVYREVTCLQQQQRYRW